MKQLQKSLSVSQLPILFARIMMIGSGLGAAIIAGAFSGTISGMIGGAISGAFATGLAFKPGLSLTSSVLKNAGVGVISK